MPTCWARIFFSLLIWSHFLQYFSALLDLYKLVCLSKWVCDNASFSFSPRLCSSLLINFYLVSVSSRFPSVWFIDMTLIRNVTPPFYFYCISMVNVNQLPYSLNVWLWWATEKKIPLHCPFCILCFFEGTWSHCFKYCTDICGLPVQIVMLKYFNWWRLAQMSWCHYILIKYCQLCNC